MANYYAVGMFKHYMQQGVFIYMGLKFSQALLVYPRPWAAVAEAPAERTFCRLSRKRLCPCMKHRLTSMYLLCSHKVRRALGTKLRPLLASQPCQTAMSSQVWHLSLVPGDFKVFHWSLGIWGARTSLTNPISMFPASARLLIQVYMEEAVSPSFLHDVLLPLTSQLTPGCHSGKHIFLVQGRIQ